MGSATREALGQVKSAVAAARGSADLATGAQLLAAGRTIGGSGQLLALLTDPGMEESGKRELVDRLFGGSLNETGRGILYGLVGSRWSRSRDLLVGIEEAGIRWIAVSTPEGVSVERELFEAGRIVMSDAGLELALGSKLGARKAKLELVERLFRGRASDQTVAIIRHLVQQPRGRRLGELFRGAGSVVADESGQLVAVVASASPLDAERLERLRRALTASYGRPIAVNPVIDRSLLGGVRVQIGDDVIDGSVAARLTELREQLVG